MRGAAFRLGLLGALGASGLVHCVDYDDTGAGIVLDSTDAGTETSSSLPDAPFDAGTSTADSSVDAANLDASDADAGKSAPRCDRTKPFDAPVPVPGLSDPAEAEVEARLTNNELAVYYECHVRTDADGGDLTDVCVKTRNDTGAPFAGRQVLDLAPSGVSHSSPTVSDDELSLVYMVGAGPTRRLFEARRQDVLADFSNGADMPGVNDSEFRSDTPLLLPSGNVIYYTLFKTDTAGIYRSERPSRTAKFGVGVPTNVSDGFVFPSGVTEDERDLFFTNGVFDLSSIFEARRESNTAEWAPDGGAAPKRNVELNVGNPAPNALDAPSWLSADGCVIYFTSNRPLPPAPEDAGKAGRNVWRAQRPR